MNCYLKHSASTRKPHTSKYILSSKGGIDNWKMDRLNKDDQVVDLFTPLENMFNHSHNFLFIQTEPFVQKDEKLKCLDETVMIFFKRMPNQIQSHFSNVHILKPSMT